MNKFRSAILGGAGAPSFGPLVSSKSGRNAEAERLESVEIPRDAGRSADHRDEDRHRLARETATIGYKGKKLTVDLINLSGGGAMIEADIKPRLWDRVDLYLGDGSPIECAVRWLRKSRIGLEFAYETHIECDAEQRNALLLEVIRRSFPDLAANAPAAKPEAEAAEDDVTRRGEVRHPLIWNGAILWQHDEHKVRLRNISTSGVLVDSQADFPEGAEVMLDLGDCGQYFATVSWSRGGQAGLLFKAPFDLSALAAGKPEIAPQRSKAPTYLDLSSDQSSPWDSGWQRRDLTELRNSLEGFLKY